MLGWLLWQRVPLDTLSRQAVLLLGNFITSRLRSSQAPLMLSHGSLSASNVMTGRILHDVFTRSSLLHLEIFDSINFMCNKSSPPFKRPHVLRTGVQLILFSSRTVPPLDQESQLWRCGCVSIVGSPLGVMLCLVGSGLNLVPSKLSGLSHG